MAKSRSMPVSMKLTVPRESEDPRTFTQRQPLTFMEVPAPRLRGEGVMSVGARRSSRDLVGGVVQQLVGLEQRVEGAGIGPGAGIDLVLQLAARDVGVVH